MTRGCRPTIALGLILTMGSAPAVAAEVPGLWKTQPADHTALARPDLSQPCGGPDTTPVCVFKTYLACALYDAPKLCSAAGLEGVLERGRGEDASRESAAECGNFAVAAAFFRSAGIEWMIG